MTINDNKQWKEKKSETQKKALEGREGKRRKKED